MPEHLTLNGDAVSIDNMLNRYWRLNNLYSIINEDGKSVKFKMRQVQDNLYRNMSFRNIILKARQLGNTSFIDLLCLDICLFTPNIRAGIIAHTKADAKAIHHDKIWFPYNSLPDNIRKSIPLVKSESSELRMINNSSIRVGTSFRSATSQFLHISEYGKICAMFPKKAREILTGCIPTVHAGSFLFIEGTAEGRSGHFFDMCEASRLGKTDGSGQEIKSHFFKSAQHPRGQALPYQGEDSLYMQAIRAGLNSPDPRLREAAQNWGKVRKQFLYNVLDLSNPSTHYGQDGIMRSFILGCGATVHGDIGVLAANRGGMSRVVNIQKGFNKWIFQIPLGNRPEANPLNR